MVFLINQRKSIGEEHPRSFSLIALIQEGDDQNHQKVMFKSSESDAQNHHHDRPNVMSVAYESCYKIAFTKGGSKIIIMKKSPILLEICALEISLSRQKQALPLLK